MNIQGQAALVSGANSGIGAEVAQQLTDLGAKVTGLDISYDDKANPSSQTNPILAIQCNVTDASSAKTALATACEQQGTARVLVNCAGVANAARIINRDGSPMPLEDFKKVIEINLIGSFNLMRLMAADLAKLEPLDEHGERGVIINTASAAAFEGQVGQAAYTASKGGITALTLQAAREFSPLGIRVVTIAPGLIATPMMLGFSEEIQQSLGQQVPFPKRLGLPSEYAKLAIHIIENQYINGETIRLDGGLRMQAR